MTGWTAFPWEISGSIDLSLLANAVLFLQALTAGTEPHHVTHPSLTYPDSQVITPTCAFLLGGSSSFLLHQIWRVCTI